MASTRKSALQVGFGVALAMSVLTGCGGAHARYESHLQRGQRYLENGNLDKAGVEFRNATQIEPKSAVALYYNGKVAESRTNIREAYGFYQAALDADSNYDAARAGLGKMLVFAGQAKQAQTIVAPGLAKHPDDAELLAVRAAAHQQLKEKDLARADAEHAVRSAPTNENALAVLAALYAESKEYPRAISLLTAAVDKVPTSVGLHEVLANLYLTSGQPDQAEQQIRRIIELKPLEMAPRSQLAMYLARKHDVDGAQRVLQDAVAAFTQAHDTAKADSARLALADLVVNLRSRAEGEKMLRDFIARDPDNNALRLGLGALLQRTGALPEALAAYQEVVTRDGLGAKGLMARDRMAAIQMVRGQAEPARKLLAEVLGKNPRDNDALILRSTLEMQKGDADGAIGDLRAAMRDMPDSVPLQRSLAAAYQKKGQPALAEETLRAGMQRSPNDVLLRTDLAELLARTDRVPQAITLLEETVQRVPDNIRGRETLIKAYMITGNLRAARDSAEQLKTLKPQSAVGFYYAGLIAAQEKHLDESQADLEQALQLEPRNATFLNMLGELHLSRKELPEATDLFTRASAADAKLWQAYRNLARVKLVQNDPAGALEHYEVALKLAPAEPALVAETMQLLEHQGRVDEAIAGYEALYRQNTQAQQFAANNLAMLLVTYKTDRTSLDRALALTSNFTTSASGPLLDTVGWVRFKRGEFKDALPSLEQAVERTPDSRVFRYHLAMVQLQLGLRDRARSNLESALTGAGSFQGAEEARTALASLKARA